MHFEYEIFAGELPEDCITDCSQGTVDGEVSYWRSELKFTVDQDRARDCLRGYGAWDDDEIAEMCELDVAEKILWLACCDFREGNEIFVMER